MKPFTQPLFARTQLLGIAHSEPEKLVDIVLALQDLVIAQQKRLVQLEARVEELESRLAQDSHNSHRPPSSDDPTRPAPKSLRESSGRSTGGQPGHPGHTLKAVVHPDAQVRHPLSVCPQGHALSHLPALRLEKRQVFDLPVQGLEVVEHQADVKYCPACQTEVTASFPPGVGAPVQYGSRFLALLVYWRDQQLLPLERVAQMAEDLFGQPVSEATVQAAVDTAVERLSPFDDRLRRALQSSPQAHADETGCRVKAHLHWLHVLATPRLTWYGVHPKRGGDALDDFFLLPPYAGRLIHDGFAPYWDYGKDHALCNAHILRELTFAFEQEGQAWAQRLKKWLLDRHKTLEEFKAQGRWCTTTQRRRWRRRYRFLLARARPPLGSKGHALRLRLKIREHAVLAFLRDPTAPFTNNLAEQDLRMMKVQQNISGGFRTFAGAEHFARVRSYLSTVRKQGLSVWDALTHALRAQPFLPPLAGES